MLDARFAKLIENHSEELAAGLIRKLHKSERTVAYHDIPVPVLERQLRDVYQNLSLWLVTKTDEDIQERYEELGRRRAEMGVPPDQFAWALMLSKEHLWHFLRTESITDQAMQLLSEIDFLLFLERFFDRALYYGLRSYSEVMKSQTA